MAGTEIQRNIMRAKSSLLTYRSERDILKESVTEHLRGTWAIINVMVVTLDENRCQISVLFPKDVMVDVFKFRKSLQEMCRVSNIQATCINGQLCFYADLDE